MWHPLSHAVVPLARVGGFAGADVVFVDVAHKVVHVAEVAVAVVPAADGDLFGVVVVVGVGVGGAGDRARGVGGDVAVLGGGRRHSGGGVGGGEGGGAFAGWLWRGGGGVVGGRGGVGGEGGRVGVGHFGVGAVHGGLGVCVGCGKRWGSVRCLLLLLVVFVG